MLIAVTPRGKGFVNRAQVDFRSLGEPRRRMASFLDYIETWEPVQTRSDPFFQDNLDARRRLQAALEEGYVKTVIEPAT